LRTAHGELRTAADGCGQFVESCRRRTPSSAPVTLSRGRRTPSSTRVTLKQDVSLEVTDRRPGVGDGTLRTPEGGRSSHSLPSGGGHRDRRSRRLDLPLDRDSSVSGATRIHADHRRSPQLDRSGSSSRLDESGGSSQTITLLGVQGTPRRAEQSSRPSSAVILKIRVDLRR